MENSPDREFVGMRIQGEQGDFIVVRFKGWGAFLFHLFPIFLIQLSAVISLSAWALPMPNRVESKKPVNPIRSGVLTGGFAAEEFSLLKVEAQQQGARERIVISYGDRFGKPHRGEPGYFHVALDRNSSRVVIDLAQVTRTAIDLNSLRRQLAASKFVASSEMTMDPQDSSTNITLVLKQPAEIDVETSSGGASRLMLTMSPIQRNTR